MWSFAAIALAEWQSGKTSLQQAVEHPIAAVSFGLLISVASLAPKFAAGVSLSAAFVTHIIRAAFYHTGALHHLPPCR